MIIRFAQHLDGTILDGFQEITESIEQNTGINAFALARWALYAFWGTLAYTLIFGLQLMPVGLYVLIPLGIVVQLAVRQISRTEASTRRGMLNLGPFQQLGRIVVMAIVIGMMLFSSPTKSFQFLFILAILIMYLTSCTPLPPGSTKSRLAPQGAT